MDNDLPPHRVSQATDLLLSQRRASVSLLQRHFSLGYSQAMRLMARLADEGVVEEPNPLGRYHVALDRLPIALEKQGQATVHVRMLRDLAVYLLENHGYESTACVEILAQPFPYHRDELRALVSSVLSQQPQDALAAVALALASLPAIGEVIPVDRIADALVADCAQIAPELDRDCPADEARHRGLVRAMRYLQRRILQGGDPHSRAVDCFVHRSLLPTGQAVSVSKVHHEHVVPCAFLQRRATELLRRGIPVDEVATWIEPYLRVVEIEATDAGQLDGPEGLKSVMPEGWRFGGDCVYARLHHMRIRFTPPAEGPGCACGFHDAVQRALGQDNVQRSGATLYSSVETLRPGAVYLLGTNPGGDGEGKHTIEQSQLHLLRGQHNAYFDEEWDPQSKRLQVQVQALLRAISPGTERQVCASNLIFFRSATLKKLSSFWDDANTCWPVHEYVLDLVRPRLVVAFGNGPESAYGFLREKLPRLGERDLFPSGHGDTWCEGFRTTWAGAPMFVAGLPHLSRYNLSEGGELRPRITRWLQHRLSDAAGEPPAFLTRG